MIFISLTFIEVEAEDFQDNIKAKSSFSFQVLGPEMLGFHYNHYLSENISANAGIGWGGNLHIGVNYYPFKVGQSSFYIGTQICRLTEVDIDQFVGNYGAQPALYFPIGVQLTSKNGFTVHLEAGYNIFQENYSQRNTQPFLFTLRLGKTWFKQKSENLTH